MHHDPEEREARTEIAEVARAMMRGDLSFIVGARRLLYLKAIGRVDDDDPDFDPFIVIDSETDALPIGAERDRWAEYALDCLQPEIARAEKWAQEFGRPHCQRLIDRFAK